MKTKVQRFALVFGVSVLGFGLGFFVKGFALQSAFATDLEFQPMVLAAPQNDQLGGGGGGSCGQ